jgi:hypothetical protein
LTVVKGHSEALSENVPSEENNKVFGRAQSFVPGSAADWYLQLMVKDSKKYAATDGWGYAQFDKDGNPADAAKLNTCAPATRLVKLRTSYSPITHLDTEPVSGSTR